VIALVAPIARDRRRCVIDAARDAARLRRRRRVFREQRASERIAPARFSSARSAEARRRPCFPYRDDSCATSSVNRFSSRRASFEGLPLAAYQSHRSGFDEDASSIDGIDDGAMIAPMLRSFSNRVTYSRQELFRARRAARDRTSNHGKLSRAVARRSTSPPLSVHSSLG